MNPCGQRAEYVRLMQVIGSCDDDGVELLDLEEILDVGAGVANAEAVGEGASLRPVVVTHGGQLDAAHLGEHRDVRELRYGAGADETNAYVLVHERGPRTWPNR